MTGTDDIEEVGPEAIERVAGVGATLRAFIRDGPLAYVDNAPVAMKALVFDGLAIPIVIAAARHGRGDVRTDVCSPSSHFVDYALFESRRRHPGSSGALLAAAFRLFGALLDLCRIDQVVYVDNWLFATNPATPLSLAQAERVTGFLRQRYPRHAIVHRSVNPALNAERFGALQAAGYRMIRSRIVYVLDPRATEAPRHKNVAIDRSLLAQTPLSVTRPQALTARDVATITSFYRRLYLGKHSPLNPQFNERFFAVLARDPFFTTTVLRDDAGIRGFMVHCLADGHVTGLVMGYDPAVPRKAGLYRQLVTVLIVAAEEAGLALNLSGGAGDFKRLRGALPRVEYDAVYARHLPWWRRLAWWLVGLEGRVAGALGRE